VGGGDECDLMWFLALVFSSPLRVAGREIRQNCCGRILAPRSPRDAFSELGNKLNGTTSLTSLHLIILNLREST